MKDLLTKLEKLTNGSLVLGAEVEFYIKANHYEEAADKLKEYTLEKEQGTNQYEVSFGPHKDIELFIYKCKSIQTILKNNQCFLNTPKPFPNDESNSFHIHFNIEDKYCKNLFENASGEESNLLLYSVGGLLKHLKESMQYFAPDEESLLRYTPSPFNPTKICWGGNNRTTALRIPPKSAGPKRIEHRVPSSTCKMPETIYAIVNASYEGIKNKIQPPQKIFGNAFLDQYSAEKII